MKKYIKPFIAIHSNEIATVMNNHSGKPGHGHGDDNHDHDGPPGQNHDAKEIDSFEMNLWK